MTCFDVSTVQCYRHVFVFGTNELCLTQETKNTINYSDFDSNGLNQRTSRFQMEAGKEHYFLRGDTSICSNPFHY